MLHVHLGENLESTWRDIVDRELDLSLLRLDQKIYSLSLSLNHRKGRDTESNGFLCAVKLFNSGEMISDFEVVHNDGRFAVRQTLARARRTLARREGFCANTSASNRTASGVLLR